MKTNTYTHIHTYIQSDENAQPSALHTPPHKSNSHNDTGELGAQGILNHYFPQAQTGGN